ncbi:hypothetical protein LQU94_06515 [Peptoniphilus sp. KCTC 25270]|uniref:hypothetical protein n=1 Tax=Peptoniphilus sp. KCTC 25270 TaxID=2897414 RepID=UPI001E2C418C|nr:hypothetical protein [Peptoniphilus sp. KCTC 25270]MCD1147764.1 hypothetical protein [Peptoniphilus sp. KCTC 25270]
MTKSGKKQNNKRAKAGELDGVSVRATTGGEEAVKVGLFRGSENDQPTFSAFERLLEEREKESEREEKAVKGKLVDFGKNIFYIFARSQRAL